MTGASPRFRPIVTWWEITTFLPIFAPRNDDAVDAVIGDVRRPRKILADPGGVVVPAKRYVGAISPHHTIAILNVKHSPQATDAARAAYRVPIAPKPSIIVLTSNYALRYFLNAHAHTSSLVATLKRCGRYLSPAAPSACLHSWLMHRGSKASRVSQSRSKRLRCSLSMNTG